jgi:replicative DNA helicase
VNVRHYALLVREESRRREMIRVGNQMVAGAYDVERRIVVDHPKLA